MSEVASNFPSFRVVSPAVCLDKASSLTEVLRQRTEVSPDETHLHLWQENDQTESLTYSELFDGAAAVARGLRAGGLRAGETAAIMLPSGREFFFSFLGVWLAGGIPVPIYPPFRADKLEEYAHRQSAILHNAEVRILITFRQVKHLARLLKPRVPSLTRVVTAERLLHSQGAKQADGRGLPAGAEFPETSALDDITLIQYTSGSTGEPRGVALTHRNLVANLRAIGHGVQVRPDDVTVCWLPLYHDMGLIGCWLFSLYFGLPIAVLSPLAFLRRPERWLRALHRHRGTLSPAPNFAYEFCVRKIDDRALAGLDLSSWRVALNGAEPVSADTIARFTHRFAPYGFRPEAMMPVYGLAESSVALTFAPLGQPPRIHAVAREVFQRQRRAQPAPDSDAQPLRFVSVGRPLPEHEVRVVDDAGWPVEEGVEGHLQFCGPSTMHGYYRDPEATAAARTTDGWYRTGDLAYYDAGEIFITGRTKDLIIKAGRNIYPQEIEEAASDVAGIRRGCVVAFAVPDPRNGTDALVLVAETRESDPAVQARLAAEVKRHVGARCRVSPEVVRLVPPQVVPKTPSGKIRRAACRELYLRNALTPSRAPVWLQVARLLAGDAVALLKKRLS